jgi:hypothetical protein
MVKRNIYKQLKNQTKVIAIARAYDGKKDELVRLAMLAGAATAGLVYFFSFFFSFTLGRVPAED